MAAARKVDYDLIEGDWRAGIKSPGQIAAEYTARTGVTVSRNAICKHFDKIGVPRDLNRKVHAKADAMVAQAMVTGKVETATTIDESAIVEAAAHEVAAVRMAHRSDITRMRRLVIQLLAECEVQAADPELFADLAKKIESGDSSAAQYAFDKATSLPSRIKSVRELSDTLRTLVGLEREAYGLDRIDPPDPAGENVDMLEAARRIAFVLAQGVSGQESQVRH